METWCLRIVKNLVSCRGFLWTGLASCPSSNLGAQLRTFRSKPFELGGFGSNPSHLARLAGDLCSFLHSEEFLAIRHPVVVLDLGGRRNSTSGVRKGFLGTGTRDQAGCRQDKQKIQPRRQHVSRGMASPVQRDRSQEIEVDEASSRPVRARISRSSSSLQVQMATPVLRRSHSETRRSGKPGRTLERDEDASR